MVHRRKECTLSLETFVRFHVIGSDPNTFHNRRPVGVLQVERGGDGVRSAHLVSQQGTEQGSDGDGIRSGVVAVVPDMSGINGMAHYWILMMHDCHVPR